MSNRFIPDRETGVAADAMAAATQHAGEREFDARENVVIGGLAMWMGVVGAFTIVIGGLQTILGLLAMKNARDILTLGQGVLMLVVGGLLFGASRSFKDIVKTSGSDINHLMSALGKLRTAYTIQGIVLIVVCALIAVMIFLAIGGAPHAS